MYLFLYYIRRVWRSNSRICITLLPVSQKWAFPEADIYLRWPLVKFPASLPNKKICLQLYSHLDSKNNSNKELKRKCCEWILLACSILKQDKKTPFWRSVTLTSLRQLMLEKVKIGFVYTFKRIPLTLSFLPFCHSPYIYIYIYIYDAVLVIFGEKV